MQFKSNIRDANTTQAEGSNFRYLFLSIASTPADMWHAERRGKMSDYTQLYVRFLQRFHCQHLKVFKFWTFERIFYIIITWIMIIMRFYSNGLCCLTFGDRLRLPIISFSDLPPTQLNVQPKLQGLSLPPNCQHNPVMSSEYFLKIGKEVEINVEPKL